MKMMMMKMMMMNEDEDDEEEVLDLQDRVEQSESLMPKNKCPSGRSPSLKSS